jgi:hypothetical protein
MNKTNGKKITHKALGLLFYMITTFLLSFWTYASCKSPNKHCLFQGIFNSFFLLKRGKYEELHFLRTSQYWLHNKQNYQVDLLLRMQRVKALSSFSEAFYKSKDSTVVISSISTEPLVVSFLHLFSLSLKRTFLTQDELTLWKTSSPDTSHHCDFLLWWWKGDGR